MKRLPIAVACAASLALLIVLSCGEAPVEPSPPPSLPQAHPTTVSVSPAQSTLVALGAPAQLAAEVRDQSGNVMTGVTVAWSSGDGSVATVDSAGLVTASGNGQATIAARVGAAAGSAAVTVRQEPAALLLAPDSVLFTALGDTARLTARVVDASGHTVANAVVAWSTADSSIASVDQTGLVEAIGPGVTRVTAAHDSLVASAGVEVVAGISGDRQVLEILYRAWNGDGWDDRANWLTDAPLSEWAGVGTDQDGNVNRLFLGGQNLEGRIPAALGLLQSLIILDLSENELRGPIPSELGRLTVLRDLLLGENDLSGPLPPELGDMAGLRYLYLSATNLSGPIPDTFARLALRQFYFYQTLLCVPRSLYEWFARIEHADDRVPCVPATADREVLAALYEATGGADWHRRRNWLSDASLNNWHGVKVSDDGYVTELALGYNNLAGSMPPELGDLAHIERLELFGNQLTGTIPPEIGQLTNLRGLYLSSNSLEGPIPSELGDLVQVDTLYLSENQLSGPIPPELGGMTALERLSLFGNQLSGPLPRELGRLTRLKDLWLGDNVIEGSLPAELGEMASLEQLDLSINRLTGSIPRELGGLSNLKLLSLFENGLSGAIPPDLGSIRGLETLWLSDNELAGTLPPELGALSELARLNFGRNQLSGPIPPEFGALRSLTRLALFNNNLSGPLPPELGELASLEDLSLSRNPDLQGLIPRNLLNAGNLATLSVFATGLCAQIDPQFQAWLSQLDATLEECDAARVERLALSEIFAGAGGESWTRRDGWNTSAPVGDWHGLTLREGRVRAVALDDNGLTGPVPPEFANLTELESVDLGDNRLAGEFPVALASMAHLASVRFSGNQRMAGPLPFRLTDLTRLVVLEYEDTDLCASPAKTFQDWLATIAVVAGATCGNPDEVGLALPVVYLTQAIQRPEGDVPLIAGREALLRVFLTSDEPRAFYEPQVEAIFTHDGREVHRTVMERDGDLLPTEADEADLRNSYNAVIPAEHIRPGLEMAVEADPAGLVPVAAGSQTRFPLSGTAALNVIEVPPMELTVVPVLEAADPDSSIFAWTDNVGDDSPEVGLLQNSFPFSEFTARSREPYFTSLDLTTNEGQWRLVLEMEVLRAIENGAGYYYGAAASVNGFVRGRARLAAWASIGKPWDLELAHEVGHNLDLLHAPCGGALDTDPGFPHPNGGLGAWGFDFRDGTVVSAERRRDIMGYCYERGWLSDYYFEKVIEYRERVEGERTQALASAARPASETLVLWGGVVNGELKLEPAFRVASVPRLPEDTGPYRVQGVGRAGETVFSLEFEPGMDKFGDRYFLFTMPIRTGWADSLDRITLAGPEGTVSVGADADRPITLVTDAATGSIRAILRGPDGDLPNPINRIGAVRVSTSRGIRDAVRNPRSR